MVPVGAGQAAEGRLDQNPIGGTKRQIVRPVSEPFIEHQ
jgi:hypothetical protein